MCVTIFGKIWEIKNCSKKNRNVLLVNREEIEIYLHLDSHNEVFNVIIKCIKDNNDDTEIKNYNICNLFIHMKI